MSSFRCSDFYKQLWTHTSFLLLKKNLKIVSENVCFVSQQIITYWHLAEVTLYNINHSVTRRVLTWDQRITAALSLLNVLVGKLHVWHKDNMAPIMTEHKAVTNYQCQLSPLTRGWALRSFSLYICGCLAWFFWFWLFLLNRLSLCIIFTILYVFRCQKPKGYWST